MAIFSLRYAGSDASRAEIDFYDIARAILGFQRSLALTVHLVQNGEIITHANALKNARLLAIPPREGSWEFIAGVVFATVGGMAVAPKDTVAGHLARSIYDYALNALLGMDVDFDKLLRSQHGEYLARKKITESKLDSLIEKIEPAVTDIHRPIVKSGTAHRARIRFGEDRDKFVGPIFSPETFEHIDTTIENPDIEEHEGVISSYNINTYRGRIYLIDEERPIPFELSDNNRNNYTVGLVADSLKVNALDRFNFDSRVVVKGFRRESSAGRLKSLWITDVEPPL